MLWTVEEAKPELEPEPVPEKSPTPESSRPPIKFQIAPSRDAPKRQRVETQPTQLSLKLPAKPPLSIPRKTIFKLKSFSCGGAAWHTTADINVKLDHTNRRFEIHYGKNSLSSLHPDVSVLPRTALRECHFKYPDSLILSITFVYLISSNTFIHLVASFYLFAWITWDRSSSSLCCTLSLQLLSTSRLVLTDY